MTQSWSAAVSVPWKPWDVMAMRSSVKVPLRVVRAVSSPRSSEPMMMVQLNVPDHQPRRPDWRDVPVKVQVDGRPSADEVSATDTCEPEWPTVSGPCRS